MTFSNTDRLALLQQVELQAGNWREALEDLITDAEDAVIAEEAAESAAEFGPAEPVSYHINGEDVNRWDAVPTDCSMRYRDTL